MALEPGQYTRREPGSASASLLYPADVFCAKTDGSFYDTERACGRDVSVRVRRICAKRTRHNFADDTFLTLRNRYAGYRDLRLTHWTANPIYQVSGMGAPTRLPKGHLRCRGQPPSKSNGSGTI